MEENILQQLSTPGKATINVTVEGKTTPFKFRVKSVPDPIAMIGQAKVEECQLNAIKAQQGVRADLRDFVFEGVKFDIVGFTCICNRSRFC